MTLLDEAFQCYTNLQNTAYDSFDDSKTKLIISILQSYHDEYRIKKNDATYVTGVISLGAMILTKKPVTILPTNDYSSMVTLLVQCIKIIPKLSDNEKNKILQLLYCGKLEKSISFILK